MSIWPYVKVLFDDVKDEILPSNLETLLSYIQPETSSITTTNHNQLGIVNLYTQSVSKRSKTEVIKDLKELEKFQEWAIAQFDEIIHGLQNNLPFPSRYQYREYQCIIIISTLIYDRWYENNQKTGKRVKHEKLKYAFVLWHLQMGYRLWDRWKEINRENGLCSPVWYKSNYFRSCPFFTVPEEYNEIPVILWSPQRQWKAMELLTRNRRDYQLLSLSNDASFKKFNEYRTALFDGIAITAFFKLRGPISVLYPDHPTYFIVSTKDTSKLEIEILTTANNTASGDQRAVNEIRENYNKKLRDDSEAYIDKEKKQTGLFKFDSTETMLESIKANKKVNINEVERTIRELQSSYDYISSIGINEDDEGLLSYDDIEESDQITQNHLKQIQDEINELKEFLQSEKATAYRLEQEQEKKDMKNFLSGITQSQVIDLFVPTALWYMDNMILSNYLYIWNPQIKRLNPFKAPRRHANRILFTEMLNSMKVISPISFMNNADEWIRSRSVDFWERERYRSIGSGSSEFKIEEARLYSRADLGDSDSIKYHDLSLDEILQSQNPNLRYRMIDYIGYWWLGQKFHRVNIDKNIFYWDLEYEFVNLRRPILPSPIITKIGSNWCIFKGGVNWDFKDWLNVVWCGPDLLDCVIEWLRYVAKDDWKIVDREKNKLLDLSNTDIRELTKQFDFPEFKIQEQQQQHEDEDNLQFS